MAMRLRIGILGAAGIARKNVAAMQNDYSLCQVIALASRSQEKANRFVEQHISTTNSEEVTIFSGETAYEDLVSSPLIDAVYIPLPTSMHKEWVIKALRSGKHVLVEKPVTTNMADFNEMYNLAREVQKYILDGTMFVHNPRTIDLMNYIDSSAFGKVLRINSEFTIQGDDEFFSNNVRIKKDCDPLGCVGDLSWYSIRMALLVMKQVGHTARKVKMTSFRLNDSGVPIDAAGMVHFSPMKEEEGNEEYDEVLTFHCSFMQPLSQRVEICGSKQTATITDFVIPRKGSDSYELRSQTLTDCDKFAEDSIQTKTVGNCETVQEVYMWRHFSQTCRTMEISESTKASSKIQEMAHMSYQTQLIVIALMDSIREEGREIYL